MKEIVGTVIRNTGSASNVLLPNGSVVSCKLAGQYRMRGLRTTSPIAVGDVVDIRIEDETNSGTIKKIHQRRNYVIRKSVNLSKEAHVIASNLDQALVMATVHQPRTSFGFIDRFLCTAEAYRIEGAVLVNKCDLNSSKELRKMQHELVTCYRTVGYPVFEISALNQVGLSPLKKWLSNKVTLLAGHSGVGKSTLINRLRPDLEIRTAAISDTHNKGTHTTTFAEMHLLPNGGSIIDTPGIKEFGLIDMEKRELSHYFPEIFEASKGCRFNNCLHQEEPGCAVRNTTAANIIPKTRYSSYLSMLESIG